MKNLIKNRSNLLLSMILLFLISTSCNNSNTSLEKDPQASGEVTETVLDLAKEKAELQKSFNGIKVALAGGDAKAVANFFTEDGVFMPHNSQIFTGREEIEIAFTGFIEGGFTKLDVEPTWVEGCGEYLLNTEKWTLSNGQDTLIGKSLVIWKKEDNMWKIHKDMINTDTP